MYFFSHFPIPSCSASSLFIFINIHHENELSINSSRPPLPFFYLLHYLPSSPPLVTLYFVFFHTFVLKLYFIPTAPFYTTFTHMSNYSLSFMMALVTYIYQPYRTVFSASLSSTYFNYLITHILIKINFSQLFRQRCEWNDEN